MPLRLRNDAGFAIRSRDSSEAIERRAVSRRVPLHFGCSARRRSKSCNDYSMSKSFEMAGKAASAPRADIGSRTADRLVDMAVVICLIGLSRAGTSGTPAITNVCWFIGYAALCLWILRNPEALIWFTRRNLLLISWPALALISATWSYTPLDSAFSGLKLSINPFIGFMLAYLMGLKRFIIAVFISCLFGQTYNLTMGILSTFGLTQNLGDAGIYLHKNHAAIYGVFLFFTAAVLMLSGWRRYLTALAIVIACANVVMTRSGTGMVALVVATITIAGCLFASLPRRGALIVFGASVCVIALATLIIFGAGLNLDNEILDLLGKDQTLTGRTILWHYAGMVIQDNPLLGIGYFSYWYSPYTTASQLWAELGQILVSFHNMYLDVAVSIGLIGLALFVATLLHLLFRSTRAFLENGYFYAWPLVYLVVIVVYGFSEYPLFWNSDFQLMLGVIAGVASAAPANRYRLR
jgi:exopolysaccharide production protein ExoQ